jgi:predicted small metal-binding protein
MYTVSCRQLGFADCEFVATGKHRRTVIDKVLTHWRDEHPELIRGITAERHEELEEVIDTHIVEAAAA